MIMRKFHTIAIAAATLLTASATFAQTTRMDSGNATMSNQDMNATQQMNDVNHANMQSRAPAAMDPRATSYDSSMPADRGTASGASGTTGGYAAGTGQYNAGYGNQSGNRYGNQYNAASNDRLNGSGHYADTAIGSQLNANDVHATPQPGALNNQLFRGN
jgi:hypothetical protein